MRVGLVDDDETAMSFVREVLSSRGYRCVSYRRGRDLLAALPRETFDLLVIDWNMAEVDGLEIVQWARTHLTPCPALLMLTSRADKDDLVAALEAGADDYIVKPETARVISARVDALLRRTVARPSDERHETYGRYVFDRQADRVLFDGRPVALTPKEYALAHLMFQCRDRPMSRAYLLEAVWKNVAELSTRTLDMHVSRLRSKLQLRAPNGFRLQTVFGYGYRLETCAGDVATTAEADADAA